MAKDPYKYFRIEASDLLEKLSGGLLELEKGVASQDQAANLLRFAHTLKGAAQVVRQPEIAEAAHALEGALAPFRDGAGRVPADRAAEMLGLVDRVAEMLAALGSPAEAGEAAAPPRPSPPEPADTVRVEVEEVEALLCSLSEAEVVLAAFQDESEAVKRARRQAGVLAQPLFSPGAKPNGSAEPRTAPLAEQLLETLERLERGFAAGIERIERELQQARERANRLRLLPAETVFPSLARAVRDAAVTLGKHVEFQPSGSGIRLDAHVLVILREALLHLIRNAVAHGIETEPARLAAGKLGAGRIEVSIESLGGSVAFVCRDDGAGIDVAAIRRAAVKKGIVTSAEAASLGLNEAIDLIFHGGVSTSRTVDGISGRGIGLDVVRDAASRLKGEIKVETKQGVGTRVEICVPVSRTSAPALMVQSAGAAAFIPLGAVRQAVRATEREFVRSGAGESFAFEGQALPFLPLTRALGRPAGASCNERRVAVIVTDGAKTAAVGVEKLLRTGTVLVQSLPPFAAAEPVVAGASLDGEGNPVLVLDPAGLVAMAIRGEPAAAEPTAEAPPHPILVIDDSLTTRMVEQNILESAGHQVELATSAEEALAKAHARRYSLFLVDVEMPGMDGFQFISCARDDPVLHGIPSILVTSRNSAQDKHRAQEAGARAYIVKSEFDQGRLLEIIQQLVR